MSLVTLLLEQFVSEYRWKFVSQIQLAIWRASERIYGNNLSFVLTKHFDTGLHIVIWNDQNSIEV